MRKKALTSLLVLIVLLVSACMPIPDPAAMEAEVAPPPMVIEKASEVPRISLDEAKEYFDNGTATFVDSRSKGEYDQAHIAGAIHVAPGTVSILTNELPKDQLLITYCT